MIDLTLGVFFCLCMRNLIDTKYLVTKLLIKREEARCSIMNLLQWLMGVPAGLKLNHELSAFMGNFFIYHVYIWIAYLNVLEPYLEAAINLLTLSSCASFSLYLSFLNDLINLASFHVYCFYAYAAKFYHLLLTGLISLFRLFMGKKWNILRHRVDSVSYDTDQLVFGTIVFTILLFLLPTVMLYYIVFMIIRMTILIVQTMLYCVVYFNNFTVPHMLKANPHQETRNYATTEECPTSLGQWLWKSDDVTVSSVLFDLIRGKVVKSWKK